MTVISESISSLLVIVPPTHAAGIDLYQAFAGSHARMHSLNCNINGLLGSVPYSVRQINSAAVMVEVEEDPTIQQYRIKLKNGTSEQTSQVFACIPPMQWVIQHLMPGTKYTYAVKASVPGEQQRILHQTIKHATCKRVV